ncbi:MAG: PEP-CTERM sorting domain-containing protein [Burkholderiales bacterium]
MKRSLSILCLLAAFPTAAGAITVHLQDFIEVSSRTAFNGFESIPNDGVFFTGSFPYTEDGISVAQVNGEGPGDIAVKCLSCFGGQFDGAFSWYPGGGDFGYTRITHLSGGDFVSIGFTTGFGDLLARGLIDFELFDDGIAVMTGSVPVRGGTLGYLGFSGGGFDEIRVRAGSISSPALNALALDSIEEGLGHGGATVPEPGTIALLGFALAGLSMGRRSWRSRSLAVRADGSANRRKVTASRGGRS